MEQKYIAIIHPVKNKNGAWNISSGEVMIVYLEMKSSRFYRNAFVLVESCLISFEKNTM